MREFSALASRVRARRQEEWNRFGQTCATIANTSLGKGNKTFRPRDFIPDIY